MAAALQSQTWFAVSTASTSPADSNDGRFRTLQQYTGYTDHYYSGSICVGTAADAVMSTQRLTAQTVHTQRMQRRQRVRDTEVNINRGIHPATHTWHEASDALADTSDSSDTHAQSEVSMTTQRATARRQLQGRHDIDSQP
eukprot:SAG25_NODE_1378_length_3165_cov_8.165036_3_plen_141_part_00